MSFWTVAERLYFIAQPRRSLLERGGKGSFQAVKLQRPARTTVCSHSTRDMAATSSIESQHDNNDTQNRRLYSCEQF
jgi:hypothetical protein